MSSRGALQHPCNVLCFLKMAQRNPKSSTAGISAVVALELISLLSITLQLRDDTCTHLIRPSYDH